MRAWQRQREATDAATISKQPCRRATQLAAQRRRHQERACSIRGSLDGLPRLGTAGWFCSSRTRASDSPCRATQLPLSAHSTHHVHNYTAEQIKQCHTQYSACCAVPRPCTLCQDASGAASASCCCRAARDARGTTTVGHIAKRHGIVPRLDSALLGSFQRRPAPSSILSGGSTAFPWPSCHAMGGGMCLRPRR